MKDSRTHNNKMRPKLTAIIGACGLAGLTIFSAIQPASAQAGKAASAPGTPPIGRQVEISLSPWSYGQSPQANQPDMKVSGVLLAMTDRWIVVQEGSYENWVPMDRVVVMRASR